MSGFVPVPHFSSARVSSPDVSWTPAHHCYRVTPFGYSPSRTSMYKSPVTNLTDGIRTLPLALEVQDWRELTQRQDGVRSCRGVNRKCDAVVQKGREKGEVDRVAAESGEHDRNGRRTKCCMNVDADRCQTPGHFFSPRLFPPPKFLSPRAVSRRAFT